MHKKLAATLTIAIFILSTFAIMVPAQAHFTLGNLMGTYRFHANDFDPHVAGPIGYVWPGSGQDAYSGALNGVSANLSPGYQSPYPGGNPPGAPSNSWYQLEGDTYAPFGAVLTNSTGDLIFAINATGTPDTWSSTTGTNRAGLKTEIQTTLSARTGWGWWDILIPPGFTVPDASQIVSTLSNAAPRIVVFKLGPYDRYAPGWTVVSVAADGTVDASAAGGPSTNLNGYYNHQFINFTNAGEWYYVRINGVTAPSTAGRYFFKMALVSESGRFGVGPTLAGGSGCPGGTACLQPFVWVPPQNWPVVLVKGEVDPAIITGTLRYAGYNSTLYQQPIAEAGKVWAHMTMRIDPYTGQQRPDLPTVDAQAYVNATANGHYELEGLAPGVYDIYASAAGYPQLLCTSGITVLKGQSLHFDCYLQPGPVIHGNVFTKHQFGDEPWPGNATTGQYIKVELYANATLSNLVDPSAGPAVSWSPLPCVAGGQDAFYGRLSASACGDPRNAAAVAFPWHEYSTVNGAASQYSDVPNPFTGAQNGYSRDVAIGTCDGTAAGGGASSSCHQTFPDLVKGSTLGVNALLSSDPMGVGPPQHWFVAGGTTTPFHFEFGVKGEYGAPRDLDGMVPQVYATWVNGLTAGRYYVRVWTFRYVQTALDGATFQEYYFDVTPNEWAGDVTLPIDLRLSSWVNKTVYFHDTPNTITTSPIASGAGYMWGTLMGADGHVYAANVTGLGLDGVFNSTGVFAFTDGQLGPPGASASDKGPVYPGYYYDDGCYGSDGMIQDSFEFYSSNAGTFATGESGAPSQACPRNHNGFVSELDKSGLNENSIATGRAAIQFWGINDTWGGEDSGIPSGTYTPNVAVNGYYSPTPPEQVSVTLSGNPTSISDHLFLGPGFNVSVYSIDFERPRVSRNWVWSGCQTNEGFGCLGSEIDVGFYPVVNGTAGTSTDWFGPECCFEPLTVGAGTTFGGLFQGPGGTDCVNPGQGFSANCAEMDGGGRDVLPGYSGRAHGAFFGSSGSIALVGGVTSGWFGHEVATQLRKDSMWTTPYTEWPSHFAEGPYNLAGYTYGYIQDKDFTAYAQNGQVADMKINLLIGVNVSLQILFKKESIITPTAMNMSGRVRLFNDQGQLVADWMSSEGVYNPRNGVSVGADGAITGCNAAGGVNCLPKYPFNTGWGSPYNQPATGLNGYNFIPGGTTTLSVLLAGFPQQIALGADVYKAGVYFGDPVFTPNCDFELDCYSGAYAQYPYPYTGIEGAPDYTGGWTAEVDFVPWYANNTGPTTWTFPGGIPTASSGAVYYPPVNGLLMGESYHIIPGTTATSGISLTEDAALSSTFLGHSLAANHLGPYSQEGVWQIAGTHNSGEASAIFEVDLNGFVSGNVLAFTWSNEFRTLSWGTVSVTGASGATWNFYTYDGIYQAFLPTGQYKFTIAAPGYASQTWSVSISPGQTGTGQNVYLEQSNIPVPEFSTIAVVAFSALAASLYILRRRRK